MFCDQLEVATFYGSNEAYTHFDHATHGRVISTYVYAGPTEALLNWSNLTLSTIQINVWVTNNFTTADILPLSVIG